MSGSPRWLNTICLVFSLHTYLLCLRLCPFAAACGRPGGLGWAFLVLSVPFSMCFYYIPLWGLDLKMVSIIHLSPFFFFLVSDSFTFYVLSMHLVISEEKD